MYFILENNGIIILKNILSKSEHNKIIQRLKDLEINSENSINSWIKGPHNITKSNLIDLFGQWIILKNIPNKNRLAKTNEIFGKEVIHIRILLAQISEMS